MSRKATQPKYWRSRKAYYTSLGGGQTLLASGPEGDPETVRKAHREFYRLALSLVTGSPGAEAPQDPPLAALFAVYLERAPATLAPTTVRGRNGYLGDLLKFLPDGVTLSQLSPMKVLDWTSTRRREGRWTDGGVYSAMAAVSGALSWCRQSKLIAENPVRGMKKPQMPSRGREALVSPEQYELLLAYARRRSDPGFAELLWFLQETGCRPGEAAAMEASDVVPSQKAVVLECANPDGIRGRNKRARYGHRRTILLTDALFAMISRRCRDFPEGALFRTERGARWYDSKIDGRFAWARKVLAREAALKGQPPPLPGVTPYSFRHTFATDWLLAGRGVAQLAEILGTSIAMIQKHYGHLDAKHKELRAEVEEFTRRRAAPSAACPSPGAPQAPWPPA